MPASRPVPWRERLLRAVLFTAGLAPAARLLVLGVRDELGANPVEFVTRSSGTWTLVMLCVVLAVSPLRRLTGWQSLVRMRRMLGLLCFAYACLHLLAYVWFDQWFEVTSVLRDVLKRPFIAAGALAFVLLVPLALTSTNAMVRLLGRRWAILHRAVYAVAVLAVLHYAWHKAGKNDLFEPLVYGVVLAVLIGLRAWPRRRGAGQTPQP